MINSEVNNYFRSHFGVREGLYITEYIKQKDKKDARLRYIIILFIISMIMALIGISHPIFASTEINNNIVTNSNDYIYLEKNFKENIKNKYSGANINFPHKGVAHIRKIKYINSKPIKINIVEINTEVNPYLKVQPQIASNKLNRKTTVRKIASKNEALVAINGGFFKPNTGVPLGALMINEEVITGPIYNRVGIGIFEQEGKTFFKMNQINFNITAVGNRKDIKIDNINQPRMSKNTTLLYTSLWGNYSPVSPKGNWNLLIRNNKIEKISANPIQIVNNDYVIQAPKDKIIQIAQNDEVEIRIELQEDLKGAKHIIGAGPYLIKDSQIYVDTKAQKLEAISGKNPRSALGFNNETNSLILVTVDGREKASVGMTLYELAKLMKYCGCSYAMNFDGGSSSALYVKGKIVNSAINNEGIAVSNALTVSEYNPNEIAISSI